MNPNEFTIVVIALILSAFFSGMEIAFVSANKLRIELQRKQGLFTAKIISGFMKRPSHFIAAMLAGNNITIVIYSIMMAKILEPVFARITGSDAAVFVMQTVAATILVLVAGEFIPKALFRVNPNRILNLFAVPVWVISYLLFPVVYVMIGISEFIIKKIFKAEISSQMPLFGKVDLNHFISESANVQKKLADKDPEIEIFRNALSFSEIKVRESMVPRSEIIAMGHEENIEALRKKFIETGLSKILIYKENIDDIIGYVHSYEMFNSPENIKSILLPVSIVPETMAANVLLQTFIRQRRSIAVVVDEFGGTSGIVTIEDVMEEIFGEIHDEHDVVELLEKKTGENEYLFSGRLEIDYLNEKYNLDLPKDEEYETLSGLIIHHHENIPEKNEKILIEDYIFTIDDVSETRIESVKVSESEEE